jgi:hypothetical protein
LAIRLAALEKLRTIVEGSGKLSSPSAFRYTPCTCCIREVVAPQTREAIAAVESIHISILPPPAGVVLHRERSAQF